jgi:hypothetical protein
MPEKKGLLVVPTKKLAGNTSLSLAQGVEPASFVLPIHRLL